MIKKAIASTTLYLKQEKTLYLLMIVVGIALSLIRLQDSVINRDAIVYLSTAEIFLEQGFAGAFKSYSWLPYSILGALLSKATHISLEGCFYIINTLLYAIIPVAFVRLYLVISNNYSALLPIALLVLLLPSLNGYRDMIIRDIGFWCFSLLALLSFLRFTKTQKIFHAGMWQLAIGMAFLFRVEALAWIVGLPLCLFWISNAPFKEKMKQLFLATSLYSAVFLITVLFFFSNDIALTSLQNKSSAVSALFIGTDRLNTAQAQMAQHALNEYSAEYAALIFTSGLLTYFAFTILSASGFIYLIVAVIASFKHYVIKRSSENSVVCWALALNLITLLIFLISYQFIIERYAVLAALLILLLLFQPIVLWAKEAWPHMRLLAKCSFIFLAIVTLLDILISKNPAPINLKSAGEWLQKNTSLDTPIALNDNRLLHYSGRLRKGTTCVIDRDLSLSLKSVDTLKHYPYLVIQTKKTSLSADIAPLIQDKTFEKVEEFTHGKSVIIIFKSTAPNTELAVDCNSFR